MGIVVIGAGQAGEIVVETLRKAGYDGALTLIGDEPHPPYQRPPLSKAYLLGEMELKRLFLRPLNFYEDQGITLRLGQTVTGSTARPGRFISPMAARSATRRWCSPRARARGCCRRPIGRRAGGGLHGAQPGGRGCDGARVSRGRAGADPRRWVYRAGGRGGGGEAGCQGHACRDGGADLAARGLSPRRRISSGNTIRTKGLRSVKASGWSGSRGPADGCPRRC